MHWPFNLGFLISFLHNECFVKCILGCIFTWSGSSSYVNNSVYVQAIKHKKNLASKSNHNKTYLLEKKYDFISKADSITNFLDHTILHQFVPLSTHQQILSGWCKECSRDHILEYNHVSCCYTIFCIIFIIFSTTLSN
jgi:hypothetical protein